MDERTLSLALTTKPENSKQNSVFWLFHRKNLCKVTCSELGDLVNMGYQGCFQLYQQKIGAQPKTKNSLFLDRAMLYGKRNEYPSQTFFLDHMATRFDADFEVIKRGEGLFLSDEIDWFGGSPDMIIKDRKTKELILVENKCPYHFKHRFLKDHTIKDGYLLQVIGMMRILKIKKCYFVRRTDYAMVAHLLTWTEEMTKVWNIIHKRIEDFIEAVDKAIESSPDDPHQRSSFNPTFSFSLERSERKCLLDLLSKIQSQKEEVLVL